MLERTSGCNTSEETKFRIIARSFPEIASYKNSTSGLSQRQPQKPISRPEPKFEKVNITKSIWMSSAVSAKQVSRVSR